MFHWLILPKESIPRWANLNSMHIPLLRSMHEAAEQLVSENEPHSFQIGYHAVPSMLQLHMHVVSTDFCSPCLKTKKHWNSFTTRFYPSCGFGIKLRKFSFLCSVVSLSQIQYPSQSSLCSLMEEFIKMVENGTHLQLDRTEYLELLKCDLKCHRCQSCFKTMPNLKSHLEKHRND
ncbi:Aprataxin [Fasciola gigantica]|uniref:Aprataxin n=1 Tax=Fasciola gigantica TaxID=46835 RepID=A0A504ZCT1_FASGI|nr:Aprataxin [Fasciola gigantica]